MARALRAAEVDYAEVRHPRRRRDRVAVRDVSGQSVVPVLEWPDGEAICDSVRIVEHLRDVGQSRSARERRPAETGLSA